ncbi:hypothetical protein BJ170DRAFT_126437 [Xylariales sp. AK1849]|nr:hypothetical protein BJ170DRAFT_126437 [Xylariales sp. AK1849]
MSTGTVPQHSLRAELDGPTNGTQRDNAHGDNRSSPAVPPGHSGRLIYAKPQDLPSFPSLGLGPNGSAASAAATLGWNQQKSIEIWKPDPSASASAAAVLAKDHKMAALWQPSPSKHGAQAAMLAHKNPRNTDNWKPSATDHGHSAANQAFKAGRASATATTPSLNANTPSRQKSLMAAKGAMNTRRRSYSTPAAKDTYPDEANAAANALRAATAAHKPSRSTVPIKEAGAVPYTTMNRQMFTSHPPVKPEVDEKNREDVLHASAVAMAKKMFSQQQKLIDDAKKSHAADPKSPRRARSSSSLSDEVRPMQFNTLQDAAYKLAQERLAKLHEDNMKNRDYQEYYGNARPQRKFSIRGKLRRRSSSDGGVEDQRRSQQIRSEMSIFSTKLSQVDQNKRQQDRDALLAAAQRNVQARLKGMDDKISAETGMVLPSTKSDWETKAQATAQSRSDNRLSKHGKVDIGAGKFMTQEEINEIAARRVQPTLDEITEKAELEHARQTELRLDAEAKKEAREIEKTREREVADITKKLKEQDKAELKEKKAEDKAEAKARKEEDKAAKAEQKRLAKSERHKSAPILLPARRDDDHEEPFAENETVALNTVGQPVRVPVSAAPETTGEPSTATRVEIPGTEQSEQQLKSESSSPNEKVSPTGKVKGWFKSRFSRGSKSDDDKPKDKDRKSFIGGHVLTGLESGNASTASVDNRGSSVRAVAMAGTSKQKTNTSDYQSAVQSPTTDDVSPMSSSSDEEYFRDEARDQMGAGLSTPRPIEDPSSTTSHSPVRDSKFHEII